VALAVLVAGCVGTVAQSARPSLIPHPSDVIVLTPTARAATTATSPSATPTGTFFEPTVVDRPGVPAAIHDRYWFVSWGVVGSVGTTAYQTLPEGERLLGVANGFVASAIWLGEGRSRTRVLIRAFGESEPMRTIDTDTWVREGTIVDGVLFWAGPQAADFGAPLLDGGIWAMDLRGDEPPIAVLPAGEDLTELIGGTTAERKQFQLSPTRRTLASTIAGGGGYRTDVLNLQSMTPRAVLNESVVGVTDHVAIVRRGVPAPNGGVRLGAVDIDSGEVLWKYPTEGSNTAIATFTRPYLYDDSAAIALHARVEGADRLLLVSIDASSGEARVLLSQGVGEAWLYLVPELSTGDQLALAKARFEDALDDTDHVDVSLFDLGEDSLDRDVFRITLP
jgi:hypothetical protein